jgi:hypothetical protein
MENQRNQQGERWWTIKQQTRQTLKEKKKEKKRKRKKKSLVQEQ